MDEMLPKKTGHRKGGSLFGMLEHGEWFRIDTFLRKAILLTMGVVFAVMPLFVLAALREVSATGLALVAGLSVGTLLPFGYLLWRVMREQQGMWKRSIPLDPLAAGVLVEDVLKTLGFPYAREEPSGTLVRSVMGLQHVYRAGEGEVVVKVQRLTPESSMLWVRVLGEGGDYAARVLDAFDRRVKNRALRAAALASQGPTG